MLVDSTLDPMEGWGGEGSTVGAPLPDVQQQLRSRILQTGHLQRPRRAESLTRLSSHPATSQHVWQAALAPPPPAQQQRSSRAAATAQVHHRHTRAPAPGAALAAYPLPAARGRRGSLDGARAALPLPLPPPPPHQHQHQHHQQHAPLVQQAPLPGMTRTDIFHAAAPVLTARLQAELAQLSARVAEDSPQHLHSLRQVDDMVQEVRRRAAGRARCPTPSQTEPSLPSLPLPPTPRALTHRPARLSRAGGAPRR